MDFGTGNPAAQVVVVNSGEITAEAPPGSGTVDVTVTTSAGTSATTDADQFNYAPLPTVSSVSPSAGPTTWGTPATISGANFEAGATVHFGTSLASDVTVVNSTEITAVAPAGTGVVDVTVSVSGATSPTNLNDEFSYGAPTINAVSPNNGASSGDTLVDVTGSGFVPGDVVYFGTTSGTAVNVFSPTHLQVRSPAFTSGSRRALR